MKKYLTLLLILILNGCATPQIYQEKSWHVSPDRRPQYDEIYPKVSWDKVEKLVVGMSAKEAIKLVSSLQYNYNHPIHAVIVSDNPHDGMTYEVAIRLSYDQNKVDDISFKKLGLFIFEVE